MRKRKRKAILYVKNYNVTNTPAEVYHSYLMLFTSWHTEESLNVEYDTYRSHYIAKKTALMRMMITLNTMTNFGECLHLMEQNETVVTETAWDALLPLSAEYNAKTEDANINIFQVGG